MTNSNILVSIFNLASKFQGSDRIDEAIAIYHEILSRLEGEVSFLNAVRWNLGVALMVKERWLEAATMFNILLRTADKQEHQRIKSNIYRCGLRMRENSTKNHIEVRNNSFVIHHDAVKKFDGNILQTKKESGEFFCEHELCLILESKILSTKEKNFVFYDIGSNIGLITYYAATVKGVSTTVVAFDPNPLAAARFRHNMSMLGIDGSVTLWECALSNSTVDAIELYTPAHDASELSRLGGINPLIGGTEWVTHHVPAYRLDDLDLPAPHFIKIDAEDHEIGVLEGARRTLIEDMPAIFFENWFYGFDAVRTLAPYCYLQELGYVLFTPIWRTEHNGTYQYSFITPDSGANACLLFLPINMDERAQYPENINILALHAEKIPEIMENVRDWNENGPY